jgi:hypothetical protein
MGMRPLLRRIACTAGLANSAAASPSQLTVDGAGELGILSTSRATLTAGYTRRFWCDRAYAEARLGGGTTGDLAVIEERAGVGLVFRRDEPVEVALGWRVGHTYLRGDLGDQPFAVNLLAVELVVQIAVAIAPGWRLHATPLAPTVYWHRTYSASLGLEAGVAYAF